MTHPTPRQLADARALLTENHALRERLRVLNSVMPVAESVALARFDRTDYSGNPAMLAHAIPDMRSADAATATFIRNAYHHFLITLSDGERVMDADNTAVKVPPQKLDFHALPVAARPYLLAPMFQLMVAGRYLRLDLDTSQPDAGQLTYVSIAGPLDPDKIRALVPAIAAWLEGSWNVTTSTVNTFTLTSREPLPAVIPYSPAMLKKDHLFLGINVDTHENYYAPFADLSHMLIAGTVGMGKSVSYASIARSLLHSIDSIANVYAVDPGGIAFSRYKGLHQKFTTMSKPHDLWTVTAQLFATMTDRENQLGPSGREKFTSDYLFLIIDEFPAYATADNPDKKSDEAKQHQQFIAQIMALGRRGRKSGIRLILTVQEPTDRDISTGLRSVLPGALAFRLPVQQHSSNWLGERETLPANPRTLQRGRAIYRDGTTGETVHVQFPLITPKTPL